MFSTLCFSKLNGQSLYEKLNQRLVGISNFHETMRIVDSIYAIGGENLRDNGGDRVAKVQTLAALGMVYRQKT